MRDPGNEVAVAHKCHAKIVIFLNHFSDFSAGSSCTL